MRQVRLFISGFVQGVNFRYFVKREADKSGIRGWVRNLRDGRVEVVLQGRNDVIEDMIKLYRKGPLLSEVSDVEVIEEEAAAVFKDFSVISG